MCVCVYVGVCACVCVYVCICVCIRVQPDYHSATSGDALANAFVGESYHGLQSESVPCVCPGRMSQAVLILRAVRTFNQKASFCNTRNAYLRLARVNLKANLTQYHHLPYFINNRQHVLGTFLSHVPST